MLPIEIGRWYRNAVIKHEAGTHLFFENDFSQFDSTISRYALELEFEVYKRFGVCTATDGPLQCSENKGINWARRILDNQLKTLGYDKFGNKYEVDGNRKSGDPNTSCGNSLVNGLATLFVFAILQAKIQGCDVMDITMADIDMQEIILGDDNTTSYAKRYQPQIADGTFERLLKRLGFVSKLTIRPSIYHAEFCSQRFWCIDDNISDPAVDSWCLGPKPSKWLSRHAITTKTDLSEKDREVFLRQSIQAAFCTASFVPVIRNVLTTYVSILNDQKLFNWLDALAKSP